MLRVFRAGALGDFVVTLPALRTLAELHGPLHFVGNASAARGLAPDIFASIESIDDPRWAGLFAAGAALPPPDVPAVVLLRDRAAAARLVDRGWSIAVAAAPFPHDAPDLHVAEHLLRIVAPLTDRARGWGGPTILASGPRRCEQRSVVIHPGSGSPRKNWPVERFAAALAQLAPPETRVSVPCGPADDLAAARHLAGAHPAACIVEAPTLPDLVELLAGCDLYLGNDSGVSHLAGAVGAPTLAIFGPTRAARWAPRGPRVAVVEPCERCALCQVAEERPAACDCLRTVGVDRVLAAAERLLAVVAA